MQTINIANLVLTRKCNLHCDYCRISGDINYITKPREYPHSQYYFTSEKTSDDWNRFIDKLVEQNPEIFLILIGGEPFLYKELAEIVLHLNKLGVGYTIISNSTTELKEKRFRFFDKVGKIKGYTSSVDPGVIGLVNGFDPMHSYDDEAYKSNMGYITLRKLIRDNLVEDPVAELTCDYKTIHLAIDTIKTLSDDDIWSDLTVLDIAKNDYYDFSSIINPDYLVPKNEGVKAIFDELINSDLKIHMKKTLLPRIYGILPAELDCKLGKGNIHNITIDSDMSIRLCYRIKGHHTPQFNALDLFTDKRDEIEEAMGADKNRLCQGCSHTCYIMSQLTQEEILNHLKKIAYDNLDEGII